MNRVFNYKKLHKDAIEPKRAIDSIGYDLFSLKDIYIPGLFDVIEEFIDRKDKNIYYKPEYCNIVRIYTGIAIEGILEIGEFICDRSSMGHKGITCLGGIVDGTYRNEISVLLANVGPHGHYIIKGEKIAQLIFKQVELPELIDIGEGELNKTVRNKKGFGEFTGV